MTPHPDSVLVVDDLEIGRRASTRLIERLGYRAVSAGSAVEALALASTLGSTLTVVLTDLNMPGHDGRWLLRALRERALTVPVVACSGSFLDTELTAEGFDAVLPKPFSADAAQAVLSEVIRAARRPVPV